jgi:hypothetical protein
MSKEHKMQNMLGIIFEEACKLLDLDGEIENSRVGDEMEEENPQQ